MQGNVNAAMGRSSQPLSSLYLYIPPVLWCASFCLAFCPAGCSETLGSKKPAFIRCRYGGLPRSLELLYQDSLDSIDVKRLEFHMLFKSTLDTVFSRPLSTEVLTISSVLIAAQWARRNSSVQDNQLNTFLVPRFRFQPPVWSSTQKTSSSRQININPNTAAPNHNRHMIQAANSAMTLETPL